MTPEKVSVIVSLHMWNHFIKLHNYLSHCLSTFNAEVHVSCYSDLLALELYLAGRKGLVLHGHSAVGSQDDDSQLLLSLQSLLVPVLHGH